MIVMALIVQYTYSMKQLLNGLVLSALLIASLTACGKEEAYSVFETPEAKSCEDKGGKSVYLLGDQFCQASGLYCVMPGERTPCN